MARARESLVIAADRTPPDLARERFGATDRLTASEIRNGESVSRSSRSPPSTGPAVDTEQSLRTHSNTSPSQSIGHFLSVPLREFDSLRLGGVGVGYDGTWGRDLLPADRARLSMGMGIRQTVTESARPMDARSIMSVADRVPSGSHDDHFEFSRRGAAPGGAGEFDHNADEARPAELYLAGENNLNLFGRPAKFSVASETSTAIATKRQTRLDATGNLQPRIPPRPARPSSELNGSGIIKIRNFLESVGISASSVSRLLDMDGTE